MNESPPIEGIVETILYVADLPRAIAFYRDVLGFSPMIDRADGVGAWIDLKGSAHVVCGRYLKNSENA